MIFNTPSAFRQYSQSSEMRSEEWHNGDIVHMGSLKDKAGFILYFSYCQQNPWKDQNN